MTGGMLSTIRSDAVAVRYGWGCGGVAEHRRRPGRQTEVRRLLLVLLILAQLPLLVVLEPVMYLRELARGE